MHFGTEGPVGVWQMCLGLTSSWVWTGRNFGADAVIMTGINRVIVLWIISNSADKTLHGACGALRTANISVLSRGLISAPCILSPESELA